MEPTQMELMLFAAGSRSCAKTLASQGKAQDLLESAVASGSSISASSKKRSRATSSSKTCQPFALADWIKFSGHSLRSGMMRNGIVSPLPPLAHLTDGIESGLWATPTTMDGMAPKTEKALRREATETRQVRTNWANLRDQVVNGKKMWPTPKASDTHAENPQTKQARNERLRAEGKPKGCGSPSLATRIEYNMTELFPTPCARDWKDNGRSPAELERNSKTLATHAGGSLNPTWVEWLMGFPLGWTELKPSETASFRKSRKSSDKQ